MTIKSPHANDLLFPGEQKVQKTMSVSACYQDFHLTDSKKNVYTDNHSGISARQRDSNVSMTDLVSAEDDVNLRMSTGLLAAIDKGRRMTIICLCVPSDTTVSEWQKGAE